MEQKTKLPIGIENFEKLRTEGFYYVDKTGFIKELLDKEEIEWLDQYHRTVYEKLSPDLNEEEQAWLKEATSSL